MAKQLFDPTDEIIWRSIVGNKGFLPSARTENLVDILERDLGLNPVMLRIGDDYDEYTRDFFYKLHIRDRTDGFCRVFYHPQDCERATGSNAHNWLQWASTLLGYGRASHDLAPRFGLPSNIRELLADREVHDDGRTSRLLSLELVVFYLAAQTSTWDNPARIFTVKDRLLQQDIPIKAPTPDTEDINVDSILPENLPETAPHTKSRYPRASAGLRDYNPAEAQPSEVNVVDIEDMSDDDLSSLATRLMAVVTKRQREREAAKHRRELFEKQAGKIRLLGGVVMPDRGEFATITATYKDEVRNVTADTIQYVRADLLSESVRADLVSKGLLP